MNQMGDVNNILHLNLNNPYVAALESEMMDHWTTVVIKSEFLKWNSMVNETRLLHDQNDPYVVDPIQNERKEEDSCTFLQISANDRIMTMNHDSCT
jgi:hypothetical protein